MQYIIRPDVAFRNHTMEVPLDYNHPNGPKIEIFAREYVAKNKIDDELPYLIFFHGGPGGKGVRQAEITGWLKEALKTFRVVALDQRGTGLSTPLTAQTITKYGKPHEQAAFLTFFRADSIVHDAEKLREHLRIKKWSTMGQSYGGFVTFTYLSLFPKSLDRSIVTGGVPPINYDARTVYNHTLVRLARANKKYFELYPEDQKTLNEIRDHINYTKELLPTGDRLTPERLQLLGIVLGRTEGIHELHFILEEAFVDTKEGKRLSASFLTEIMPYLSYATKPLYVLLHETIYAQGRSMLTNAKQVVWGLKRYGFQVDLAEDDKGLSADFTSNAYNIQLVGEIFEPWLFRQDDSLKPLKETFHELEKLTKDYDWLPLYNAKQLAENPVPVACLVYEDDVFVDKDLSLETLSKTKNAKAKVTSDFQHDGIHCDGERLFAELLQMTN
ncbi:MAG: alpha/beta fold hydrolase [Micrococcaceae bacterium]